MKKFLSSLIISSLLFAMQFNVAAANVNKQMAAMISADTDIYIEFDLSEVNPFTDLLKKTINQNREDQLPFNEPGNILAELALEHDSIAIALQVVPGQYDNEIEGYLIINGVNSDKFTKFATKLEAAEQAIDSYFNDFENTTDETSAENSNEVSIGEENPTSPLAPLPHETTTNTETKPSITSTENYKNAIIKTIASDTYGLIDNKYLVLSDNAETIKKLVDTINNSNVKKLNENANYQKISSDFIENGFLHAFLSGEVYDAFIADIDPENQNPQPMEAIGISANQQSSTFNFVSTTLLKESTQEAYNIYPERYNFYPRLSKRFTSQNAIIFFEQYDIQQQLTDIWELITTDQNSIPAIEEFTGLNLSNTDAINKELISTFGITLDELKELTSKHIAFAAYDNSEKLPGMTIALNVSDHTDIAERVSQFLQNEILTKLEDIATKTSTRVAGKELTSIELTTNIEDLNFLVTIGVVENNLILSTDRQIKAHYGNDGISGNVHTDKSYNSISYIVPNQMGNYIDSILEVFKVGDASTQSKIGAIILQPFGETFSLTEAKGNWTRTTGKINISTDKFADYENISEIILEESFKKYENEFDTESDAMESTGSELCDISNLSEESQVAINSLTADGIVKGDIDGCFHPTRSINRAEFITLIDRAFSPEIVGHQKSFSDVPTSAWYADAIGRASAAYIINGYADGTFRPDQPINRAEAISILNKVTKSETTNTENPFSDISESHWFYKDILSAYHTGIINSASHFRPGDNLTREEAALIIYRAL